MNTTELAHIRVVAVTLRAIAKAAKSAAATEGMAYGDPEFEQPDALAAAAAAAERVMTNFADHLDTVAAGLEGDL